MTLNLWFLMLLAQMHVNQPATTTEDSTLQLQARSTTLVEEKSQHTELTCEALSQLDTSSWHKICNARHTICCAKPLKEGLPEKNDAKTQNTTANLLGLSHDDKPTRLRVGKQIRNSFCKCIWYCGCKTSDASDRVSITDCLQQGAGQRVWGVTETGA